MHPNLWYIVWKPIFKFLFLFLTLIRENISFIINQFYYLMISMEPILSNFVVDFSYLVMHILIWQFDKEIKSTKQAIISNQKIHNHSLLIWHTCWPKQVCQRVFLRDQITLCKVSVSSHLIPHPNVSSSHLYVVFSSFFRACNGLEISALILPWASKFWALLIGLESHMGY